MRKHQRATAMATSANGMPTTRAVQARILAGSVLHHIKDAPDEAGVGAKARVLRAMCGHLDALAEEASRCCGTDCMGRRTDGFSFWVPHDRLAREAARADGLREENARLRAVLLAIAQEEHAGTDDWMDQLIADPCAAERRRRDMAIETLLQLPPNS